MKTDGKSGNQSTRKKTYVKPGIREVKLRPEEAVLGNCKYSGSVGPIQAACSSPASCKVLGS